MNDKKVVTSGVTSITGLLGVVFVTLKLCEVIDWSWWWVLLPFYGPVGLALFVCLILLLIAGLGLSVAYIIKRTQWGAK